MQDWEKSNYEVYLELQHSQETELMHHRTKGALNKKVAQYIKDGGKLINGKIVYAKNKQVKNFAPKSQGEMRMAKELAAQKKVSSKVKSMFNNLTTKKSHANEYGANDNLKYREAKATKAQKRASAATKSLAKDFLNKVKRKKSSSNSLAEQRLEKERKAQKRVSSKFKAIGKNLLRTDHSNEYGANDNLKRRNQ